MKTVERYVAPKEPEPPEESELAEERQEMDENESPFIQAFDPDGDADEVDCPRCGAPIWSTFRYCPQCGEKLEEEDVADD